MPLPPPALTSGRGRGPPGADRCEFDTATGNISDAVLAAPSQLSPSWLRWHPTLPVLYSTQETNEGSASALVSYRLTGSGELVETGRVSTCGGSACHFTVHPSCLAIACANHGNYQDDVGSGNMSGSVAVVSICPETGALLQLVDFMPHLNETSAAVRADSRRLICAQPPAPNRHRHPCAHPATALLQQRARCRHRQRGVPRTLGKL